MKAIMNGRAITILATFCVWLSAAEADNGAARVHLAATSSTPVLDITETLITKYAWNINYEDWSTVSDERLVDVEQPAGRVLRVRHPTTVSADVPAPASVPSRQRRDVVRQLLESYRRSDASVVFECSDRNGALQIYPVAVRQSDGTLQRITPLFDTPVNLSAGSYSLGRIVDEVIAQIEQKRGVSIALGTVPQFLFQQDTITEESAGEPARDLLLRAFSDINGPRLARKDDYVVPVWSLRFEPTSKVFYLNVGFAERVPFSEVAARQTGRAAEGKASEAQSEPASGGVANPFEKPKQQ